MKKVARPLTTAQSLAAIIKSARDIMRKDKGLSGDGDRLPMLTWIMFLKFLDDHERIREDEALLSGERFIPAIESPYRWRDWAAKADGITGDELIAFINQDEAIRPDGNRGAGLFAYLKNLQGTTSHDRRDTIAAVFRGTVNRMINGYLLRDVLNKLEGIHFNSSEELHVLSRTYETLLKEMRDASGDAGEFYTPRPVVKLMVELIDPKLGETVLDPACGTGGFLVEAYVHMENQCLTVKDRQTLQQATIQAGEAKPLPFLLANMNLLLHGLESPDIDGGNSLRFPLKEIGDAQRVDVILTNPPFGGEEERGILGNFPEDKQTAETALLFLQLIMRKLRRNPKPGRAAVVVPESVMGDSGVAQRIREQLVKDFNLHTVIRLPRGVFEPYSDIQTNILFFNGGESTDGIWFYQHEVPDARQAMKNPCYTASYPILYEELEPISSWFAKRQETDKAWYVSVERIREGNYSLDIRHPKAKTYEIESPSNRILSIQSRFDQVSKDIDRLANATMQLEQTLGGASQEMALSSFLRRIKRESEVNADFSYKQITVRLYGKGVMLRQEILGQDIKTRPQFIAAAGQLIMSRIDARSGAFGIVPAELDGALVTQDFPLFEIDTKVVIPEFLALLLRSKQFASLCAKASRGTTNRKRLNEALFLGQVVLLPDIKTQNAVVKLSSELEEFSRIVLDAGKHAAEIIPDFAEHIFSNDGV